jgi:hypothetical protein
MAVFEELSNASEFEEQISNLQGQIDGLDDTYATDTDIQGLQGQIDTLEETISGLGSGGSSGGFSIKTKKMNLSQLFTFSQTNFDKILSVYYEPTSNVAGTGAKITIGTDITSENYSSIVAASYMKYYFKPARNIDNSDICFTTGFNIGTNNVLRLQSGSASLSYYDNYYTTTPEYVYINIWNTISINTDVTVTYIE